jgi:hypothetical protein
LGSGIPQVPFPASGKSQRQIRISQGRAIARALTNVAFSIFIIK